MHRLRTFHSHTQLVLAGILAVFVWLNLSYSMQPYTEHLQGGGWSGGVRYGLPFVCWDSSQDAVGKVLPSGQVSLTFTDSGGIVWLGLLGNLGVLAAAMSAVGWAMELARSRMSSPTRGEVSRPNRIHRASYAAALCVAAVTLWMNVRVEVETTHQDTRVEYKQSMGWPLEAFTASEPAKWEFARAHAKAQPMIEHLRENPNATFRLGHWHAQNVSLNCVIGGMLTILSITLCEILLRRQRRLALQTQPIPVSSRD